MRSRRGFTMVELLVVVGILLLIGVMVLAVFRADNGSNKLRDSVRIGQSAFLGARDRALHAKEQRGLRLIRDPQDARLITSFNYVQPVEAQSIPSLQLERPDVDNDGAADSADVLRVRVPSGTLLPYQWALPFPALITIPAVNGQQYVFSNLRVDAGAELADLATPFPQFDPAYPFPSKIAVPTTSTLANGKWQPGNELLPNHSPVTLPSGMVLDLSVSSIPTLWNQQQSQAAAATVPAGWMVVGNDPGIPGNVLIRPSFLDVMFSPRGNVTGAIAVAPMHFVMRDLRDATLGLSLIDPKAHESLILTVYPQTGHVQSYPVDVTDTTPADGVPDNPFSFAQRGSRN